jgi:hypothetical protein
VFRDPVHTGKRGRPQFWADLLPVQVVKPKAGRRLLALEQRLCLGTWAAAQRVLCYIQT